MVLGIVQNAKVLFNLFGFNQFIFKESNNNSTTIEIKSETNLGLQNKWNFANQMASGSDPHANQNNVTTQIKIEKKPKIERKRGRPRKKVSEEVPVGE